MMHRRTAAKAIAASLIAPSAFAQTKWPEKPVKLVVGFTPGSATADALQQCASRM